MHGVLDNITKRKYAKQPEEASVSDRCTTRGCAGASSSINSEFNLLLARVTRTLDDRGDKG